MLRSKILTAVISTLVSLLLVEGALRLTGPKYHRFSNRSDEYYTNPRGYHIPLRHEGNQTVYGLVHYVSPEGYRVPDDGIIRDETEGTIVLGLGDSFTFGRGVKYEDLYLTRLERKLKAEVDSEIVVRNCGVVGADLDEILETCERESERTPPTAVVYGFVLNDFGVRTANIVGSDFIDINNGGYQYSPWRKASALVNLVCHVIETRRLHNSTMQAYFEAFSGEEAKRKFGMLSRLNERLRKRDAKLVIVLFPLLYGLHAHYPFQPIHDKIAAFCQEQDIPLLDLLQVYAGRRAEDLWVNPTDHHPNEIAHRLAGDAVFEFVRAEVFDKPDDR